MQYIYLKPQLENLSQGERIAFVRQFRKLFKSNGNSNEHLIQQFIKYMI